jgi:hypothetical protein
MFTARGELFCWLDRNGRDDRDCGPGHRSGIERHGVRAPRLLAVHVNYLAKPDCRVAGPAQGARRSLPAQPRLFSPRAFSFDGW